MLKIFGLMILFSFFTLHAMEVDNFTLRYKHYNDELQTVDQEINLRLKKAESAVNRYGVSSCSRKELFLALGAQLLRPVRGQIEEWMYSHPTADVKRQKLAESIYFDFPFLQIAEGGFSHIGNLGKLAGLVQIHGVILGTDKLGHFFDEGWSAFLIWKQNHDLTKAIRYGIQTEAGLFGISTTRVMSYADTISNFQGLRFWSSIVDDGVDGVTPPYFQCENGQWTLTRSFTFADFIDEGWDEGINCNSYATKDLTTKMEKRLLQMERDQKEKFSCPVRPAACSELQKKYYGVMKEMLHPLCAQGA